MSKFKKIAIQSLDPECPVKIEADFNPKELSFEKSAGWTEESGGKGLDFPNLQFTNGKAIKMSVELLFDAYEKDSKDVRPVITNLMQLVHVCEPLERPPVVQVVWNSSDVLFNGGKFIGVVESISTKYTMFTSDGIPCRATATISLTQADKLSFSGAAEVSTYEYVAKEWNNASDITEDDMEAIMKEDPDFKIENANFPLKMEVVRRGSEKKSNISSSAE
jgi:hypothetical protein